ncbi:multidrug effflux MFS transporter [Microbacterium album]|uniref:Bcr/CflA family drug resistance efflux transporter n=1 Tax=Microbacterium album TaxID=2053191 RepID=A0A917IAV7_9MICO|nr:multidrug effflux MFS transporter [Microbacterium album]GGH33564.1 Bcr/CflA family drug resistance efflux transporter [Microbacterium album]
MSHAEAPRAEARLTAPILGVLGALAILGPFGTDIFLPGLPAIASEFDAPASAAQLSLSGFTIGMAAGQLIAGPLSDAVGRRRPLLVGSATMALSSVAAAIAPSLVLLIAACLVTGLACAVGLVLSRAVVADLTHGPAATRAYAILGGILSIGPVLGPIAGVGLIALGGWRATFAGLALFAAVACAAVLLVVPETHAPERRLTGGLRAMSSVGAQAFRSRSFLGAALVTWLSFIAMFAYIASSPFVMQTVLGFSPLGYAIAFGINGVALLATSLLSGRLATRVTERTQMTLGLGIQAAGALAIVVAVAADALTPWLLLPGMFLIAAPMGFIVGPAIAESIKDLRHAVGTATAVLGSIQWLLAAGVAPLVSAAGEQAVWPLAAMTAAPIVLALVALLATRARATTATTAIEGSPQ